MSVTGMNFQVGPGSGESINVTIGGATQIDLGTNTLSIDTAVGAQTALTSIDSALTTVADIRGELGATQNRFESTISNLANTAESIAEANSRIADADMLKEISDKTINNILQHAGVAIQSQTNGSAGNILSLLR
jgi:flagellin